MSRRKHSTWKMVMIKSTILSKRRSIRSKKKPKKKMFD